MHVFRFLNIAAEKLAIVTRRQKSVKKNHRANGHTPRQKRSLSSTIMQVTNSSIKYSASNGSGIENFSTDDVDESLYSKHETVNPSSCVNNSHNHVTTSNQRIQPRRSGRAASQVSLTLSIDETKILPICK